MRTRQKQREEEKHTQSQTSQKNNQTQVSVEAMRGESENEPPLHTESDAEGLSLRRTPRPPKDTLPLELLEPQQREMIQVGQLVGR